MIQLIIVEDHESLIDGLKLLFANDPDIEVVATAQDGVELIKLMEHKKAHVILTDISMPRMNGVEVCTKVKEINSSIKVIAFTMFDDDQAVRDMINAGADGYILKIRPLSVVREAIMSVMQGNTYMDSAITIMPSTYTSSSHAEDLLSSTEREILKLIAAGHQSSQIAEIRHCAVGTVHKHRKNMIQKLGLQGKGELMRYALQKHNHYK
ncbi:chemotaxis protein CheY [Nonlabens sp. YIK11]|uniref:response regulator transcription factor n=1 Tax=Nonlabens sp. YIK11 TaxID=1453349 RepID=UPI0006DD3059|nr:response regulator transcription factor [Nonlabens sp. YIK11]KQC33922.1 chemotaxis protein CheY [Nonlabens sp. YIK11]